MAEQPVRRRRRRRRHASAGREATGWLSLLALGIKKAYHWAMLTLIIVLIMMVGFVFPAFA